MNNYYSDVLKTAKRSPIGDILADIIVAANSALERSLMEMDSNTEAESVETPDNVKSENNENTSENTLAKLTKYVAPSAKEVSVSVTSEHYIADFNYDDDPKKGDEFVKSHLDDAIFAIFLGTVEKYAKPTRICMYFGFQDNNSFTFEWDWDKESFVLTSPEVECRPKYDQYKKKFVPYDEEVMKNRDEDIKESYRDKLREEIKNANRDDLGGLLNSYVNLLNSLKECDVCEDMTLVIQDDETVLKAVDTLLRNVTGNDVYVRDEEVVGIILTKDQVLDAIDEGLDVSFDEACIAYAPDKEVDMSQIFTESRCKKIAKTFRFSNVAYDGELKLEF